MKLSTEILVSVIILCCVSNICVGAGLGEYGLNAFQLESALGNRTLLEVSGETVDVLPAREARKSPNEAFLYSLIVPGMGQLYTGAKRGYIYAAADVILLTTYFVLRGRASGTREDYRDIVREHVVFIGPGSFEDWDPIEDFEHATQYETWNHVYDSEETRARTGKWYWGDLDPSLKDEPDLSIDFDSRHRLEAFGLRQEANDTFQQARTVLGIVILNHLVSAVEARIATKRFNDGLPVVEVDVSPEGSAGRNLTGTVVLRKRF